jgi:hypothetical protein
MKINKVLFKIYKHKSKEYYQNKIPLEKLKEKDKIIYGIY